MDSTPTYRLGFAVKVLGDGGLKTADTRRWQSGPHLSRSLELLDRVFDYLAAVDIRVYRMSSATVPYGTHPDLPELDFRRQIAECEQELERLGANALAALVTRGLAELSRLALAMGGRRETLAGLSGLGDLVLTCTGRLSRNRQVGVELGRGRPLPEILAGMKMVAEGVRTAHAALALGAQHGVELPITAQMHEVIEGRRSPRVALAELMVRPQKSEGE
jgi:hypothetical protein